MDSELAQPKRNGSSERFSGFYLLSFQKSKKPKAAETIVKSDAVEGKSVLL